MDFTEKSEDIVFPDYENSILNLSCSILQHYGVKPLHHTLQEADRILSKNYQHVVVILLDGLGMNILEKNLSYRDFLRRNLITDYSSVFPPTTTASTTSFLSGKSPIEHGWLGWDVYFDKEDKSVTCFRNTLQGSTEKAADYNIAQKYLPYETIFEQINKTGNAKAYGVFPFSSYGFKGQPDLSKWVETIREYCHKDERNFIYAYWTNPDHDLHRLGTNSNDITKIVEELNAKMAYLCEECPQTAFFITADHGHTDIRNDFLEENYPELAKMLIRKPSIEPRAISFYIKPEYITSFPEEFNSHFGNDYILFTKEQILKEELFGPGFKNENLTGIGDFIAVSHTEKTILWNKNELQFKSHHAGLSKNEMRIPLISYVNKPKKFGLFFYYAIIALIIVFLAIAIF